MIFRICFLCALLIGAAGSVSLAQNNDWWHGKERVIHYNPAGTDFVKVNGRQRFNRALYGTNTAFRVEAGDLPEFALYLPGMGGNFKFGLISGDSSRWLIDAKSISSVYRPGAMIYDIKDPMLGKGSLQVVVLAMADAEGMIIKTTFSNVDKKIALLWAYGGVTGIKFSRDGDIGADPESSFYLKPQYCKNNRFQVGKENFSLLYGITNELTEADRYEVQHLPGRNNTAATNNRNIKQVSGVFPASSSMRIADAEQQQSPLALYRSDSSASPVLTGRMEVTNGSSYFLVKNSNAANLPAYNSLAAAFNKAEAARKAIADRLVVTTPDEYINTLGNSLSIAAESVWEHPSFLHGAIAWRMRLNGWRGAYAADVLGWHDRAKAHFNGYAKSQLTSPLSAPVISDTALHLARQEERLGTSMFSSGYICRNPGGDFRPHHYDMNLVFVDQLLNHFTWTGDKAYVKQMWPVLKRHLDWEKRNFDADGDGLYDAYACIWASDALQYSGGGVTHSSAYNYKAFAMAAQLAPLAGDDPAPYKKEAEKILNAINKELWMKKNGSYAEYKDLMGLKRIHPAAAIWTIYHAIDSRVPDPFQAYQTLRYVDKSIPHIPVKAKGLQDGYYLLATSNWQPYTWSINNVALAENLHTALAYWQGGRSKAAFHLWKSSIVESMYVSSSPGGFQQLSFYDAIRGELYRDFADPVAMAARTLVEGLFGIWADGLKDTLNIQPGFPFEWKHASLKTPDINFSFRADDNKERYSIIPAFSKRMNLKLLVRARKDDVQSVSVNGKAVAWKVAKDAIEMPLLEIAAKAADKYLIEIVWKGSSLQQPDEEKEVISGSDLSVAFSKATVLNIFDPQQLVSNKNSNGSKLQATITADTGYHTFFVQLKQGAFTWWQPMNIIVKEGITVSEYTQSTTGSIKLIVRNSKADFNGRIAVNMGSYNQPLVLKQNTSAEVEIPGNALMAGTNLIRIEDSKGVLAEKRIINWQMQNNPAAAYEKIDLSKFYNDKVSNIFKQQYLSPRPKVATLQLPTQGIGNWCYPLIQPEINDGGLRQLAGAANEIQMPQGIPFNTPADSLSRNIVFTSLWDNYPDAATVPLNGKASHIYLLMAGSTNPMQSRFINGEVLVHYTDGSADTLSLKNPQNWWPIEQDYYIDGYGFTTDAPKPYRLYLKKGIITNDFNQYTSIKGFSYSRAVEGGAATFLDLPLNSSKELKALEVKTLANDVVIGLMGATLVRN